MLILQYIQLQIMHYINNIVGCGYSWCVGKRDYAAPECSRVANQPSSYGILTDHNVGANVELARMAQRGQDDSYHV